jgi:membrane protease YdiL (CAAX protease family)
VGVGAGVLVGLAEYFVLKPQPVLAGASLVQMLAYIVIVLAVMVGVVEELLFRGLLQTSLEKVVPRWQAIGVVAVMFGLMHVGWMNPLEVLLAYGAGVVFGYLATETDSLIAPITAHGFGNMFLYLVALSQF